MNIRKKITKILCEDESAYKKYWTLFKDKLLALGGIKVNEVYEEDLSKLLKRGQEFVTKKKKFLDLEPSQCHHNSVCVWKYHVDRKKEIKLATGWALTPQGTWVQHSWLYVPSKDLIMETTIKWQKYFGYILTDEEANKFYWDNT